MDTKSNSRSIIPLQEIPDDIPEQSRRLIILRSWIREIKGDKSVGEIGKEKGFSKTTFYNIHNGHAPISDKMKIALEVAFNKSM